MLQVSSIGYNLPYSTTNYKVSMLQLFKRTFDKPAKIICIQSLETNNFLQACHSSMPSIYSWSFINVEQTFSRNYISKTYNFLVVCKCMRWGRFQVLLVLQVFFSTMCLTQATIKLKKSVRSQKSSAQKMFSQIFSETQGILFKKPPNASL